MSTNISQLLYVFDEPLALGKFLLEHAHALSYTHRSLAREAGVGHSSVSYINSPKKEREISFNMVRALGKVLGYKVVIGIELDEPAE